MAKFVNDLILDNGLNYLIANGDRMVVCAGQPPDYAGATTDAPTGSALGEADLTAGDYTLADGDTSGRKVTVAAQSDIVADADGDADHLAIIDTSASALLLVTTMPTQGVASGGTINTQAFDEEIADAS